MITSRARHVTIMTMCSFLFAQILRGERLAKDFVANVYDDYFEGFIRRNHKRIQGSLKRISDATGVLYMYSYTYYKRIQGSLKQISDAIGVSYTSINGSIFIQLPFWAILQTVWEYAWPSPLYVGKIFYEKKKAHEWLMRFIVTRDLNALNKVSFFFLLHSFLLCNI